MGSTAQGGFFFSTALVVGIFFFLVGGLCLFLFIFFFLLFIGWGFFYVRFKGTRRGADPYEGRSTPRSNKKKKPNLPSLNNHPEYGIPDQETELRGEHLKELVDLEHGVPEQIEFGWTIGLGQRSSQLGVGVVKRGQARMQEIWCAEK